MSELNKQQICVALGVSESTIRRLEQLGLPYTPVGARSKRYNLDECKSWLRMNENKLNSGKPQPGRGQMTRLKSELAFKESCKKIRLRVYPSK